MKLVLTFVTGVVLIALLLQSSGCGKKDADTTDSAEEGKSVEAAVEAWIDGHLDTISQEIGALVTQNLPIAKGVAAIAVKTTLRTTLKWEIVEVEAIEGGQEKLARVRFFLPLKLNMAGISEEHKVQVDYMVRVREDTVVDAYLDLDSFQAE